MVWRAHSAAIASGNPRYFLALLVLLALGGPFAAWQVARALWPVCWTVALLWVATEWCFYVFYFRRTYEEFNKIPADCKPKGFTPAEGRRNWRRFIRCVNTLPDRVPPEEYLTPWFCNAPFEDIKRDNIAEMLSYGFYYAKMSEMTGDLASVPGQMVDQLEAALHVKFTPGYTPGLRFMSHLWEPLRAHYRPLCLYLSFEILAAVQRILMSTYGFKVKQLGMLTYYTLNCGLDFPSSSSSSSKSQAPPSINEDEEDWTPFADPGLSSQANKAAAAPANPLTEAVLPNESDKSVPILFLHGVGGLMLYLEMLVYVIRLGHPVVVVEYKHVAMRLSSYIPSVDEVTEAVVRILDHEGIQRTCIVGHSYGSFMASRLCSLHKERIHGLCLIDPVCLGMFMPHLLHNFMYRRPRIDWKNVDVMVRDLVLWFASRDVHISATFARHFYWSDLNLWPEDLPPNSCIVLSGNDDLCHAEQVQKMVAAAGTAKVILNPHLFHGAFLLDPATKANVMIEVRGLLATSGSLVVRLARPVVNRTLSAARSLLHEVETLTSRISVMTPTHAHRQQQQQHFGQDQQQPTAAGRQLRRTVTDLPANAWQRIGSFGRGGSALRAAAAAVAAAGSGDGATGRHGSDPTALQRSKLDAQQQQQQQELGDDLRATSAPHLGRSVSNIERYSSSSNGAGSSPLPHNAPQQAAAAAAAAAEAPAGAADVSNAHEDDAVPALDAVRGGGASRHRPQLSAIPSGSEHGASDGEAAAAEAAAGGRGGSRNSSADGSESWEDLKQRSSSGEGTAAAAAGGDAVQARDAGQAGGDSSSGDGGDGTQLGGGSMKGVIAGLWQQVCSSGDGEVRRVHTTPAVVQQSKQQPEPLQQQLQREAEQLQKMLQQQRQEQR